MTRAVLVLLLVACKGSGGSSTIAIDASTEADAHDADAGIDAAIPIDAPAPNIELVVWNIGGVGGPDPAAIAIFYDEQDAVVQHGVVDADGKAFAYLPNGGSVTVIQTSTNAPLDHDLLILPTTVRGVRPGDSLVFGRPKQPSQNTGSLDVMMARYTPADSERAAFIKECGYTTPLQDHLSYLFFYEICAASTFDLLAVNATTPRKFVWMPDVPYIPGGQVVIPDDWQPFGTFDVSYTNIPAEMLVAQTLSQLVGTKRWELARDQSLLAAGATTISRPYAPGAGRGTVVHTRRLIGLDTVEAWVRHITGSPTSLTIDMAAQPLPVVVGAPQQSGTGATWTETGGGNPDARYVLWEAGWTAPDNIRRKVFWQIVEPALGTSTTLLPFPAAYASSDPTLASTPRLDDVKVSYVDHAHITSYDDSRAQNVELFDLETTSVPGQVSHMTRSR